MHFDVTVGFHQVRIKQRLIYKRFSSIGIEEWRIDAVRVAPSSAAQAMEGHHYHRCMHLYKESFDTLVQFRFEKMKS